MSLRPLLEDRDRAPRMVMFGGKGGVGKTTCAAASAIWAARRGYSTLIVSIDPAHSLSDSFGFSIGNRVVEVGEVPGLSALEIDPSEALREADVRAAPSVPLLDQFGLAELSSLTIPGMDEAMAFVKMVECMERGDYDLVVFDTAPTGHTLRFLSLPDFLDSWVGTVLKIRMKLSHIFNIFKGLFSRGREGEEFEDAYKKLERVKGLIEKAKAVLKDPSQTSFVLVTIPEAMAVAESERALEALAEYEIPVRYVVVNQVVPEGVECELCRARRAMQLRWLGEMRSSEAFKGLEIIEVPLFDREVRGVADLERFAEYLFR